MVQVGLTTYPERRHLVQTLRYRTPAAVRARTRRRLGFQRRLVRLLAWLTLWPTPGRLPQMSQVYAMFPTPLQTFK